MDRSIPRRRRAAVSCVACRRRKVKCNRKNPCSNCVSIDAKCEFAPHFREQRPARPSHSTEPSPTSGQLQNDGLPRPAEPEHPADGQDVGLTLTTRRILEKNFQAPESCIFLNKTKMLRASHWMGLSEKLLPIRQFLNSARGVRLDGRQRLSAPQTGLAAETGELLQKCKDIAQRLKASRPSRRHVFAGAGKPLTLPSRNTADYMVEQYFRHFESAHRILHGPTFMAVYESYWAHEWRPSDACLLVLLVVAIGYSVSEKDAMADMSANAAYEWIHAAHAWLSGPLEKECLTIRGLQVHCLCFLARTLFSYGTDLLWTSAGSLVQLAMEMGLHRDPKHLPTMSILDAEIRRRLWATVLELTLQASLDAAMPPRISMDEFDTDPPRNADDIELEAASTPSDDVTDGSMQLLLLECAPVRIQALRLMFGLKTDLTYSKALPLGGKIVEACRKCDTQLKTAPPSKVTAFHRNYLQYLLRRFLIPLHGPFVMELATQPLFGHSLQVCVDSAMILLYPELDETFSRLLVTAGGLFREGFRHIAHVFSLALLTQVESQMLDNTITRMPWQVELFTKAVDDVITRSLERARNGDVIVKTHMLLSMVKTQADAMQMGVSLERRIATSARDSLLLTHGILAEVAGNNDVATEMPDFAATGFDSGLGSDSDFMDAFLSQSFFDL